MKRIVCLLVVFPIVVGVLDVTFCVPGPTGEQGAPETKIKIFSGYRDWRLISVAREAGNLNDIRAILGNNAAITAYRDAKSPLPDGAILARLAWDYNSLVQAFAGVEKVLLISTHVFTDRKTEHANVIKAAGEAGVKHVL